MAALEIDDELPPGYLNSLLAKRATLPEESRGVGGFLRDQALNLGVGAIGVGQGALGTLETLAPFAGVDLAEPEAVGLRQMQRGWSEGMKSAAEALTQSMSPQGQREGSARFVPGEAGEPTVWDENISLPGAIAGKVSRSAPSVVASILGTVFGGPAVGLGVAAAQTTGDQWNTVRDTIEKMPHDELVKKNELYAGYLSMGMGEDEARERLLGETGRVRALIMGTITAATAKYLGIEGRIAGRAAGQAVGGRLAAAAGEAGQEAIEGVASSLLTQTGQQAIGLDRPFSWLDLVNESVEGGVIGGIMGGALGGRRHAAPGRPVVEDRQIDVDNV